MKYANKLIFLLALALCVALAGCEQTAAPQGNATAAPGNIMDPSPSTSTTTTTPAAEQAATLYIGTKAADFSEYSMTFEGELTPEILIQGIADLTGWDLALAQTVSTGKSGMSVCLSGESSLFVGPPDPQKEEFHMYDVGQLAETILDSIQKTLQMGFTGEGGDPDTLDSYYYMEGEQPLELPYLNLSWPIDEPYQWTSAKSK